MHAAYIDESQLHCVTDCFYPVLLQQVEPCANRDAPR